MSDRGSPGMGSPLAAAARSAFEMIVISHVVDVLASDGTNMSLRCAFDFGVTGWLHRKVVGSG